jgi:hypothetical protein
MKSNAGNKQGWANTNEPQPCERFSRSVQLKRPKIELKNQGLKDQNTRTELEQIN